MFFFGIFKAQNRQKTLKKHSLGHSEVGAQNCSKSTPWGAFRPRPRSTPVMAAGIAMLKKTIQTIHVDMLVVEGGNAQKTKKFLEKREKTRTSPKNKGRTGCCFVKKKHTKLHVDRRVVGWSAGRHVDHPCARQVSPWPAC